MSMEEFFCEFFELSIRIPIEYFDRVAFFEDVKVEDENKGYYMWSYGSLEKPNKQHAHIIVDIRGEEKIRLKISYHAFGGDGEDTRPPYMEDCAQWLGTFIKQDEVLAELRGGYNFGKFYSPILALPFPLLTASEDLAGSQITGVRIKLPPPMKIKAAILQRGRNETTLIIESKIKLSLIQFDLNTQLQKLSSKVMMLVTPTGETHETAE